MKYWRKIVLFKMNKVFLMQLMKHEPPKNPLATYELRERLHFYSTAMHSENDGTESLPLLVSIIYERHTEVTQNSTEVV